MGVEKDAKHEACFETTLHCGEILGMDCDQNLQQVIIISQGAAKRGSSRPKEILLGFALQSNTVPQLSQLTPAHETGEYKFVSRWKCIFTFANLQGLKFNIPVGDMERSIMPFYGPLGTPGPETQVD